MKHRFCFILPLLLIAAVPVSIYTIQFKKLNGGNVSMSQFAGKKIIVIPFNAANPDAARLHYLDSLQGADTSLQVIGVPATDFSGEGNMGNLNALSNSLSSKFVMTKQASVKKETGINQHPLFRWLSHVNANSHFDADVASPGQLFFVSKTGVLYSVLENGVPQGVLMQTINQVVN